MTGKDIIDSCDYRTDDRYSENLWRWARNGWRKNRHHFQELHVYESPQSFGRRYIGGKTEKGGWLGGWALNDVLCNGVRAKRWAFIPRDVAQFIDITDSFWPAYLATGKCALDPKHFHYAERWVERNYLRTCRWCGLTAALRLTYRTVLDEQWTMERAA